VAVDVKRCDYPRIYKVAGVGCWLQVLYEPRVEMDMLSWKLRVIRHLVDWRDQTTSRS
jgi:hypothetical protein